MREIWFKGKSIKDNQWVEGYLVQSYKLFEETNMSYPYIVNYPYANAVFTKDVFIEIYLDSVCQYTGYRDKNHNKIFENDIVYDHRYNQMACVTFLPQAAGWVLVYKDWDAQLGHRFRNSDYDKDWQLEIIGNTTDNPELLKEIM